MAVAGNCGQIGGGVKPALGNRIFSQAGHCNVADVAIVAMPLVLARYTLMQVMSAEGLRSRVHKSDIGTASPVANRTFVDRYLYDCSADFADLGCMAAKAD